MAKEGFKYESYELWLDVYVVAEIAGTAKNSDGAQTGTRNQNVWFAPAGMKLDGVWRANDEANKRVNGALSQAVNGELPGHRILVDMKRRHVKIIHRLTLPENAGKVAALKRLAETDEFLNAKFDQLPKDIDHAELNDRDWVNWLYHLRRGVDHGSLHFVKGGELLPDETAIRRMGDITKSVGAYLPKGAEELWKLPKLKEEKLTPVGAAK